MKPLKLREIAMAIVAKTEFELPDSEITEICTDSRDVKPGCLFVALCGEKFDGHAFVDMALEKGAAFAVVQKTEGISSKNLLLVKTTRQAFLDIAGLYRSKFSPIVVAVTGSVGKTTTREMIAATLSSKYNILKTENNLNNEVGVPKTILSLTDETEALLLEFGMMNLGEIRELTVPSKPDVAVITCIGTCHIEHLGSRENIKKAKFEIIEGLKKGGTLLLNKDNDMLCNEVLPDYKVVFYAIKDKTADIVAENITETNGATEFDIVTEGKSYHASIPCMGEHNVLDALAGFGAAVATGIEPEKSAEALSKFVLTGMRQRRKEHNGVTIIEDCYNANPDSVKAAMLTLKGRKLESGAKKIAVLGDMLELGEISESAHRNSGIEAAESADMLFCYGELSKFTVESAKEAGLSESYHFETKEELAEKLRETAKPGDMIWLKASRGMRFEDISELFCEEA